VISSINLGSAGRWGLNLLALLGIVLALHLGEALFVPTVIALLLAAMLWPAVTWMRATLRFPWMFACLLVVTGLVLLNLLVTLGLFLAVPKLVQDIPGSNDHAGQKRVYLKFRDQMTHVVPPELLDEVLPAEADQSGVFQYVRQTLQGSYILDALLKTGYYGMAWLWQWVLILFILFFMLLEGPMLTERIEDIFGSGGEVHARVRHVLAEMALQVRTFLVWRTIVNFGIALLVGTVYQWFGLKQPWTWAILTSILFYVPYLGPLAAGIPPLLDAFLSVSPWAALEILVFYLLIITLEGYVVVPVVMGRNMDLNATTVLLACLFWDLVWGLPGLFLAMPLMAGIKAVFVNVPALRPWGNLMGNSKPEVHSHKEIPPSTEVLDQTQVLSAEDLQDVQAAQRSK
jgi:predicted PurR-regulated permease PerM